MGDWGPRGHRTVVCSHAFLAPPTQHVPLSTTTTHSACCEVLPMAHSTYPHSSLIFLTPQQGWEESKQVVRGISLLGQKLLCSSHLSVYKERLCEGEPAIGLEPGQPLPCVAWKAGLRHHRLGEASRLPAASKISSFITMSCPKCRRLERTYGPNS